MYLIYYNKSEVNEIGGVKNYTYVARYTILTLAISLQFNCVVSCLVARRTNEH